jgi:LysR family glycine cleavage system transcriptional activator
MPKRSQLPLTALRAFEAFARLGKMSLAADELCVTHGAVSRQVRSLELTVGVKLTQGPRNALKLTDAGERMSRSLGRTFDDLEKVFVDVRAAGDRELHISCVGTLAMKWLIPRLALFHARHPELSIRITEAHGPVDFAREPFDAAIRLTDSAAGGAATPFLDNFHGPVISPALIEGGVDLARVPRLYTRSHRQAWDEWSEHAHIAVPEAPEDREYEHLFYMLEAAVAGLGAGLSPWIYAANDIASGRLVAPFGFTPTPAKFHLLIPDAPPKRGLAAFRAWLIEEAAKAPPPPMAAVG